MKPERRRYVPPTPEEIEAAQAACLPGPERPFAGTDPWPPGSGRHDPATCEACSPARTAAFARGRDVGEARMTSPG